MIKLFNAEDREFTSNGIVTIHPLKLKEIKKKSLNGWELNIELDLTHKDLIKQDMLVVAKVKSKLRPQAFRIKNVEYTSRNILFKAHHVMYDADNYYLVGVRPTGMSAIGALNYVNDRTDKTSPFTFTSNVNNSATAYFQDRSLFYAMQEIERLWGGLYDADNWDISLTLSLGVDRGETIAYGKNLEEIKIFEDWSGVVTKIYPIGFDGLRLPEVYLESDVQYDEPYTRRIDFETKFEDEDKTEDNMLPELRTNAEEYLANNKYPKVSYEVTSDINQRFEIGDTIQVKHPLVLLETEVQEYEYNIITKRVEKIIFGNYSRDVKKRFDKIKDDIDDVKILTSKFESIIGDQTELINNMNKFGHVYVDDNQILILDELPKQEALNVWRWSLGGLGFSSTGIEGPFTHAWTMDGAFNTDFIATNSITTNQLSSDVGSSLDITSNEVINGIVGQINKLEDGTIDLGDKFTNFQQKNDEFKFEVTHSNGLNLLRNSVMYNGSVLWNYEDGLTGETNVWSLTKTSKHCITGNGMNEQTVRIDNGESYSLSVDFNKQTLAGTVEVYYIINNEKEYLLQQVDIGEGNVSVYLEDIPSDQIIVGVEMTDISTTQPSYISNLMLAKGEVYEWSPALGEIYTINVLIDESGIKVKNIDGNAYTAMTPYEFAHYYDNEKVFSFDRQIAQVQDILVQGKTFELDGGIKFINDKVTNKVILVNLRGGS